MKHLLSALLCCFPIVFFAQTPDSIAVTEEIDSLIQISKTSTQFGNFERALSLNATAEKIALEHFGRESAAYGSCCHNHGRILCVKGDFTEAEKWNLDAKSIREKVLGKDDPDYALTVNNLAEMYRNMGQYEIAEPLYYEALSIWLKVSGKGSSNYSMTTFNLANYYVDLGNYETAEKLYLEAKDIWGKTQGKSRPNYASCLGNLAALYYKMGDYAKAEPLYLETKTIRGETQGKKSSGYAGILTNLATLYYAMGQYEKAEPLYIEAKAIYEKTPGKQHPDYASNLTNLAMLYFAMGQFDKAEPLYLESKSILEKSLGKEHPSYLINLNDLAALYADGGNYPEAESLYLESVAELAKKPGKEHPAYATGIFSLGIIYFKMGQFEKAEPLLLEAKSIREKTLGKEHPDYAASLNDLAVLYISMRNYEKAEPLLIELSVVNQTLMSKALQHLSEQEQSIYISKFSENQDLSLSFAQLTGWQKVTLVCYDNALFYKGFLLHAVDRLNRLAHTDSLSTDKFNSLKAYRRRLGVQYALPIAERDSATLAELKEKADALEKDLALTVAGYGAALQQVDWQDVQKQLKPSEAAVEFIHYGYYNSKSVFTDSMMYAALLLLPGATAPYFLPLFEERQLAPLLPKSSRHDSIFIEVDALYSNGELAHLLWQPLEPWLRDVKTVYYSPSGLLHRVNPAALLDQSGASISQGRQWVRLESTRELATGGRLADQSFARATENQQGQNGRQMTAVVFGGITYDMDSLAFNAANPLAKAGSAVSLQRKEGIVTEEPARALRRTSSNPDSTWGALPSAGHEADEIGALLRHAGFKTDVQKGFFASEERIKKIGMDSPSPRIVHLATHGFAYPGPPKDAHRRFDNTQPVYKLQNDPMLRAGLLLAGANFYWKNKRPLMGHEDGVLVAYEVSDLNLNNTELVVLSACETGLGDVVGSEGTYGLQRAFRIAGAKFLIVSLWQVPDEQTRELMELFYQNWLEKGESLRDAFTHAQQTMQKNYPNPYWWAGFVLVE